MTRHEMLNALKSIDLTDEAQVLAAAWPCLMKHYRGERITNAERVTLGLVYSEFLAGDPSDESELVAAEVNCVWLRNKLQLDSAKLYAEEQQYSQAYRRQFPIAA